MMMMTVVMRMMMWILGMVLLIQIVLIASPLEGSALSGSAQGWRKMCDWRQVKHLKVERERERKEKGGQ